MPKHPPHMGRNHSALFLVSNAFAISILRSPIRLQNCQLTRMHPAIHISKRLLRALTFIHHQHEQDIDSAIVQSFQTLNWDTSIRVRKTFPGISLWLRKLFQTFHTYMIPGVPSHMWVTCLGTRLPYDSNVFSISKSSYLGSNSASYIVYLLCHILFHTPHNIHSYCPALPFYTVSPCCSWLDRLLVDS